MSFSKMVKALITLSVVFVSANLAAHHSRANFELDVVTELSGTITEYSWNNPHTFVTMDVPSENGGVEEWLLELNSISVLTRSGWSRDTLEVGDEVTVYGNRDKDHSKLFFFANYFVLPDGTELTSAPNVAPQFAARAAQQQTVAITDARSGDFSGIWQSAPARPPAGAMGGAMGGAMSGAMGGAMGGGPRNLLTGAIFEASTLPVTPKGQAAVDNYNEDDNPAFECLSGTPPALGNRGVQEIVRESDDTILFRYELMDVERRVHLGMTEHPADTERTHLGHSIAWFEGETLVVDTAYFAFNRWGNGRGIPSGDQKHAVERYTLIEDGRRLRIESVQEDPEYLAEPVHRTSEFILTPDYEWEGYNCDPLATRRHLDP